ncbi:DUF3293 domain-containing protein, partial [bacterium]|nr:DUF3293 domain-containing protein [bacterium]
RAEKNPVSRNSIKKEIQRLNAEIDGAAKARIPFYEMLSVRHPEALDAIQKLDIEIEQLRARIKKGGLTDENKESFEKILEDKVRDRVKIEQSFKDESLELSVEERTALSDRRTRDAVRALDAEIALAEQSLDLDYGQLVLEGSDTNTEAYAEAQKRLSELKEKRKDVLKMMGEVEAARTRVREESEAAATELANFDDLDAAVNDLTAAEDALAGALGVDPVQVRSGNVGDLMQLNREIQDRAMVEWVDKAIEDLENSSLSDEDLQSIFESDNFAMLTGENPNARAVGEKANKAFNKKAEAWLKERGLKYHKIVGRYGNGENSFLVEGMTREQAAEFARDLGQESVAHKDGLVQGDGSINLFDGGVNSAEGQTDYFSAIKDKDGNVKKFGLMPSDTYQDADGNSITADDYSNRATELAASVDQIVEDALKPETKTKEIKEQSTQENTESGPVKSVTVNPAEDGSYGVRAGVAGLSTAEAKAVNNLMKLMSSVLGRPVKLVLYEDAASSTRALGRQGIGGMFVNGEVHLSPEQIKINAGQETEQGFKRTKSFQETLLEEVKHGVIEPAFQQLSDADQEQVVKKIFEMAKNDEGLMERLMSKEATYKKMGEDSRSVRGEVYAEFMSALSGDQGVRLSFLDQARLMYNNVLASAYGKLGKKFYVNGVDDLIRTAAAFKAARNGSINIVAKPVSEQSKSRASATISPTMVKKNDDGTVTIKYWKSIYMWKDGDRKDIGSSERVQTFRDQWHFINWWKKATDMGRSTDIFSFEDSDGRAIDVDRIKNYGRKSAALDKSDIVSNMQNRVKQAEAQGVINSLIAKRMLGKMRMLETRLKSSPENSPSRPAIMKIARDIDMKSREMIEQIAKRDGKTFVYEPDTPEGRASIALEKAIRNTDGSVEENKSLVKDLEENFGVHVKGQRAKMLLLSEYVRTEMGIDAERMTPEEYVQASTDMLYDVYKAAYSNPEERARVFGELDPVDFFKNNDKATNEDIEEMSKTVTMPGSKSELGIAYNIIKACTSQGANAATNMRMAFDVMYHSAKYRAAGGEMFIDPKIIQDLMTNDGESRSGVDLSYGNAARARSIGVNLLKMNNLVQNYTRGDGTVNFTKMNKDLAQRRANGKTVASEKLGDKIGNFALNLNGDETAITLDSHNIKTLMAFMGMYVPTDKAFEKRWPDICSILGIPESVRGGEDANIAHRKEAMASLKEKMFAAQ